MNTDYTQYQLNGVLDSPVDERDYNFKDIVSSNEINLPKEYSIEYQFEPRNQQTTSTCAFQSVTEVVEMIKSLNYQLSEGFLNAMRSRNDCYLAKGAITREIMGLACKIGLIPKSKFSNLEDYPTIEDSFNKLVNSNELIEEAKKLKCLSYLKVDLEDVPLYLFTEDKPLVITTKLYDSFYNVNYPDTDGKVPYPTYGNQVGGHAMCCCGYRYERDELYLKILNSWGKYWCLKGYCWINAKDTTLINEIWGFTDKKIKVEKPVEPIKKPNNDNIKPSGNIGYRLQLGAFKNRYYADELVEELRIKGIASCIKIYPDMFKVQIGYYKIKDNVYNMQNTMKAMGYDCFIVEEK